MNDTEASLKDARISAAIVIGVKLAKDYRRLLVQIFGNLDQENQAFVQGQIATIDEYVALFEEPSVG